MQLVSTCVSKHPAPVQVCLSNIGRWRPEDKVFLDYRSILWYLHLSVTDQPSLEGGEMHAQGTPNRNSIKIEITILLVYGLSMMLPFLGTRENRVSAEQALGLTTIGFAAIGILLIAPALVILSIRFTDERIRRRYRTLSGTVGLISTVIVLAHFGAPLVSELGPYARFSPSGGFYLYVTASVLVFLLHPKLNRFDYLSIAVVILCILGYWLGGYLTQLGMVQEARSFGSRLGREVVDHLRITGISIGISTLLGFPLALASYQHPSIRKSVFPVLNILQTIPAIALFGLLIAPLAALSRAVPQLRQLGIQGIGNTPAIIALSLYALYPIIRYSFTAFSEIDDQVIQAGSGIGMNRRQVWTMVRLPLAAPGILHGIRVALVQTIGNATLAKLIGGGGLGVLVFEGLGQASVDMVLLGMLLIIGLTVAADAVAHLCITILTPVPLRKEKETA